MIKISIITVCYNSDKTIRRTIESVISQDYMNIEYIIIDGGSSDSTCSIIHEYNYRNFKVISEKDNGIYDAINKGILLSTGDVVGILNSDDVFNDEKVVSTIATKFNLDDNLESIIGDIVFLNSRSKVVRKYSAKWWSPNKFAWGIMPPHPTFYCRRVLFLKFGLYRTDLKIAADYELLIRFLLVEKSRFEYIPKVLVKMSLGGISTRNLMSNLTINREVMIACKLNNVKTNLVKLYSKYIFKILEFI